MRMWIVLGVLACSAAPVAAQVPNYPRTPHTQYMRPPALSPYLNLALGRDPAVNYFLGVRSEMDRRIDERILNSAVLDLDRRVPTQPGSGPDADLFPTLQGTGHPAAFMNYGSYFNMNRNPSRSR